MKIRDKMSYQKATVITREEVTQVKLKRTGRIGHCLKGKEK